MPIGTFGPLTNLRSPTTCTLATVRRHFTPAKSFAKVEPPHIHIVAQLVGGAGKNNSSLGDDVRTVGHAQRLAHVVVGDQNPDAAGLQVEDDLLQLQHRNGIDAAERLVEQNEVGLDAQRARNLHPPPLAAGERIASRGADVAKIELVNQPLGPASAAPGCPAAAPPAPPEYSPRRSACERPKAPAAGS